MLIQSKFVTTTKQILDLQIMDLVGNTPLVSIPYPKNSKVKISAKCEWFNPSGSVKDRAARGIILDALDKHQLDGKILLDATSGNTGIAYAMMGASLGIPIELALPENASEERKLILKNYGAKVHLTSAMEGTDGAQRFVTELLDKFPDKYFCPDQYNNDNNWLAHIKSTGPEIWEQTNQSVTHFVAGLGTTGTFVGTSRYLKTQGVTCISVQPDSPMHALEGWKHMETAIVPGIYDETVADSHQVVSTFDAFCFARAASQYLGLQLSPSSGANLVAAFERASQLDSGHIVTIFADHSMKYLNDSFWSDDDYHIKNPFI